MIPLGVTFLLVTLLVCVVCIAQAQEITRHDEQDERETDWQWPVRK